MNNIEITKIFERINYALHNDKLTQFEYNQAMYDIEDLERELSEKLLAGLKK